MRRKTVSTPSIARTPDPQRDSTRGTTGDHAATLRAAGACAERPGAPAGAPLGTYAKKSSPAGQPGTAADPEVDHRAVRYAVRRVLWDQSSLPRVQSCGRFSSEEDGSVGIKVTPGQSGSNVAGFQGVTTCGSVWACPVCSAKVAAHRANELAQAVEWYTSQGQSVYMITLTMRHNQGQSLKDCWSALSYGWRGVNEGKQWVADKEMWGVDGWNRVTEVTHGPNGWHVHAHVVMFFNREVSTQTVQFVGQRMYQRWEKALRRKGFDAVEERGLNIRKADEAVADYLAKTTYAEDPKLQAASEAYAEANKASAKKLAGEAALGVFKEARRGNRTPFKILHSIIAGQQIGADTTEDERLWREWERSSKGRKQMQWSRFEGPDGLRLRERVGLEADDKDSEEITEEDQLKGEVVAWMPKATWNVVKHEAEFLLQAFDQSVENGLAYLRQRGLAVHTADGSSLTRAPGEP